MKRVVERWVLKERGALDSGFPKFWGQKNRRGHAVKTRSWLVRGLKTDLRMSVNALHEKAEPSFHSHSLAAISFRSVRGTPTKHESQ